MPTPDSFHVVLLSGSRYSELASRVVQRLASVEGIQFSAMVRGVNLSRLAAVGPRAILRRTINLARSSLRRPRNSNDSERERSGAPALSSYPGLAIHQVKSIGGKESADMLAELAPDVCINTGGCGILREPFLREAGLGVLNAHSGLPVTRGFNAYEWQLYYGIPLTLSAHMIAEGVDTGDVVISQELKLIDNPSLSRIREGYLEETVTVLADAVLRVREEREACLTPQAISAGRQHFAMHETLRRHLDAALSDSGPEACISSYPYEGPASSITAERLTALRNDRFV